MIHRSVPKVIQGDCNGYVIPHFKGEPYWDDKVGEDPFPQVKSIMYSIQIKHTQEMIVQKNKGISANKK